MSMICSSIGPASGAPKAKCQNYIFCLLNLLGEPPRNVYFWIPASGTENYRAQLCYDDANRDHLLYLASVERATPDTWEGARG